MFKQLRGPNTNNSFNNEPILTSTLAAGIVLDTFVEEAGEGEGVEEETTGGYLYRYFYCSGGKFFRFLALNLYHKTLTRACVSEMYVYIHIYIYIYIKI